METNTIILNFPKTITNLVGNRYGNETFKEQIENKIKNDRENLIVFPDSIEDIASSFIEGMYKLLAEKYGKQKARSVMILKSNNNEVQDKIQLCIDTFDV